MTATNPYGFDWGPMSVTRMADIEGRGYVLEITTDHARLQIHVTEKGRKITAGEPLGPYRGGYRPGHDGYGPGRATGDVA